MLFQLEIEDPKDIFIQAPQTIRRGCHYLKSALRGLCKLKSVLVMVSINKQIFYALMFEMTENGIWRREFAWLLFKDINSYVILSICYVIADLA